MRNKDVFSKATNRVKKVFSDYHRYRTNFSVIKCSFEAVKEFKYDWALTKLQCLKFSDRPTTLYLNLNTDTGDRNVLLFLGTWDEICSPEGMYRAICNSLGKEQDPAEQKEISRMFKTFKFFKTDWAEAIQKAAASIENEKPSNVTVTGSFESLNSDCPFVWVTTPKNHFCFSLFDGLYPEKFVLSYIAGLASSEVDPVNATMMTCFGRL